MQIGNCSNQHYIPSLNHFGGYINITRGSMYYYYVPKLTNKTIIWTNGGPGCSALEGMLLENGPYRLDRHDGKYQLNPNKYTWSQYANMVYVDQPMNTGFSVGPGFAHNQTELALDMVEFITNLLKLHPLLQYNELYLAGESFAGSYIPYIAKYCLLHHINIKAMIIGNGWIDPKTQYKAYVDYAVHHNLLNAEYLQKTNQQYAKCQVAMAKEELISIQVCEDVTKPIFEYSRKTHNEYCLNMYDIRSYESGCGVYWPKQLPILYEYLQDPKTVKIIHADVSKKWIECASSTVGEQIKNDKSEPSFYLLSELTKTVELYLYSGDMDFICNHLGTEAMLSRLKWNGATGFKNDPTPLYMDKEIMGIVQSERNVVYIRINNASHMVPLDAPHQSMLMIESILDGSFRKGTSKLMSNNQMGDQLKLHDQRKPSASGVVALVIVTIGVLLFIMVQIQKKRQQKYHLQHNRSDLPINNDIELEDKKILYEYEDPDDV